MAELEPTPEQLAALAAENEEAESVNYRPPAQKTLQEIQELDKDDESLTKYKQALLGSGPVVAGEWVPFTPGQWRSQVKDCGINPQIRWIAPVQFHPLSSGTSLKLQSAVVSFFKIFFGGISC